MKKLTFSGHESFHCRNIWLKKGYDFVTHGNAFPEPDALINLGVGKNMVSAIQYWMKSFGIIRENELSELADLIFKKNGFDPFLEDTATLWLLHYHLVTENFASIYSLVFNDFRKKRIEFTKKHLIQFIESQCAEFNTMFNENTIHRDISVFLRSYLKPQKSRQNIEDIYSGPFTELNLIEEIKKFDSEEITWYKIESKERKNLPSEIILYCILDNPTYGNSITFDELLFGYNSIGNIFAINSKFMMEMLEEICRNFKNITLKDDAGIRNLQFKSKPSKYDILKMYYEK